MRSKTFSFFALCVFFLICCAFAEKQSAFRAPLNENDVDKSNRYVKVERVEWDPEKPFAEHFARLGIPVILSKTSVDKWPALAKWTPEHLMEQLRILRDANVGTSPKFTYFNKEVLPGKSKNKFLKEKPTYTTEDILTEEFFAKAKKLENVYFSGSIDKLGADLASDVAEFAKELLVPVEVPFIFKKLKVYVVDSPEQIQAQPIDNLHQNNETNVWLGSAGVTTTLHYDSYHNWYAQLFGRKRFRLVSPYSWLNCYCFPRIHPSDRQSQITDIEKFYYETAEEALDAEDKRFPKFRDVIIYDAELDEGDVLYIPPFWFHHVTALDTSISVNVWSDSKEYMLLQRVLDDAMPFYSSEWPLDRNLLVLENFVWSLVYYIYNSIEADTVQFFALNLMHQYGYLLDFIDHNDHNVINFMHPSLQYKQCSTASAKGLDEFLSEFIDEKSSYFFKMSVEIRPILLANYLETIISHIVGADDTPAFIASCVLRLSASDGTDSNSSEQ